MRRSPTDRRRFLKTSALAVAGRLIRTATARAGQSNNKAKPIRLGAPTFCKSNDPEQIAIAHKKLGYRAAYCPACGLDDTQRIRDIQRAFAKHDVLIAEVGRWCNLMETDADKRAANLQRVSLL